MTKRRRKWCVVVFSDKHDPRFVSGDGGGVAWTYSKSEATGLAKALGGTVVDAEDFARRWWEYRDERRNSA